MMQAERRASANHLHARHTVGAHHHKLAEAERERRAVEEAERHAHHHKERLRNQSQAVSAMEDERVSGALDVLAPSPRRSL